MVSDLAWTLKKYAGANAVVCAYILAAEEAEAGKFLKARSSRLTWTTWEDPGSLTLDDYACAVSHEPVGTRSSSDLAVGTVGFFAKKKLVLQAIQSGHCPKAALC